MKEGYIRIDWNWKSKEELEIAGPDGVISIDIGNCSKAHLRELADRIYSKLKYAIKITEPK